jgi:carboxyl-terminal processing protease
MGEGLALGMAELGACVAGDRMAGLLGSIADYELGSSSVIVKLPFERLTTIGGEPRESFVPVASCGPA